MKKSLIVILAIVLVICGAAVYILTPKTTVAAEVPVYKGTYTPGDYFVTNIKDSYSLLKVTVVLEMDKASDDAEFVAFLTENNHVIRDTVVFLLRQKTEEELRAADVKETLGVEIVQEVNKALGIDNFKTVYFDDYVIQ